jgi:hypothetical protein
VLIFFHRENFIGVGAERGISRKEGKIYCGWRGGGGEKREKSTWRQFARENDTMSVPSPLSSGGLGGEGELFQNKSGELEISTLEDGTCWVSPILLTHSCCERSLWRAPAGTIATI